MAFLIIIAVIIVVTIGLGIVEGAFYPKIKAKAKKNGDKFSYFTGTAKGPLRTVMRVCLIYLGSGFALWILAELFTDLQLLTENIVYKILYNTIIIGFFCLILDICTVILLSREIKKYLTQDEIAEAKDEVWREIKKRTAILMIFLGVFCFIGLALLNLFMGAANKAGEGIGKGSQYREKWIDRETGKEYDHNPVNDL